MEEIFLNNSTGIDPLAVNWYTPERSTDTALVFVGGSGDPRNKFNAIISRLLRRGYPHHVFTFSFRSEEGTREYPLNQQTDDLKEVVTHLVSQKQVRRLKLIVTSRGAFSTCFILADSEYAKHISEVLFLDPADYYIGMGKENDPHTEWDGSSDYQPKNRTAASLLQTMDSDTLIHVVHFGLRNCRNGEYIVSDYKSRGTDVETGDPRLNADMVKAFYDASPGKNRGSFITDTTLPHAIERDGDLEQNRRRVVGLIERYLK